MNLFAVLIARKYFSNLVSLHHTFNILKKNTALHRFLSMSSRNSSLVAVCQLNCTSDREKNFGVCENLINTAAARGAKMVFLPECFDHVGESKEQSVQLAESLDGPLLTRYKNLAQSNSVWLSLGGFHEKGGEEDSKRVFNSHIIINSSGNIVNVYRKIHLFDMEIAGIIRLKESDYTIPGTEVVHPVNTPVGKVGLGICYDLRFPEFSLSMVKAGAEILTYPSAFTQTTGMAHWESLLRSRAIESQSYVIAAAQTGRHNPKRTSYGHAMIIDPWGCIVACCSEGIGVATAEISSDYIKKVRSEMPVWIHRRPELYGAVTITKSSNGITESTYMFGDIKLPSEQLFMKSSLSMAFVNKKCVLPGHVLVAPLRCVLRLSDLSPEEVADLFTCVQAAQKVVEQEYKASSSTISIQDGPDAGRTVPHIHVHILPRRPGDFERNDDVYQALQTHDKTENGIWRTNEDMAREAQQLRKWVK